LQGWKNNWLPLINMLKGMSSIIVYKWSTFHFFELWNVHWCSSSKLSKTYVVIQTIWFHKRPHIICCQPPSKTSWAYKFVNNHKFQLVIACCVYNKNKSETVLLNFVTTNFSLLLVSCLVGRNKIHKSHV
jgi:hypothetical protein